MSDETRFMDDVKRLRDEARVKLHLASMDVKEEWEELEAKWKEFSARAELSKTGEGLDVAWRSLREELQQGYRRVMKAIAEQQEATDHDEDFRKRINERAYQLWEGRGRPHGSPEDDWHKAEDELQRSG